MQVDAFMWRIVPAGFAGESSWERREGGARKNNKASRWSLANCAENLGGSTSCSVPVNLYNKN